MPYLPQADCASGFLVLVSLPKACLATPRLPQADCASGFLVSLASEASLLVPRAWLMRAGSYFRHFGEPSQLDGGGAPREPGGLCNWFWMPNVRTCGPVRLSTALVTSLVLRAINRFRRQYTCPEWATR